VHKWLLLLLVGIAVLLFAWSNTHHVEVGFVFGRPSNVRLIFLLLTTFLLGYFAAVLVSIYVRARITAKARHKQMAEDADENDDFFLK
jgi:uncharacterized integral membrane protein